MTRLFLDICVTALWLFPGSAVGREEQLPHVERYETVLPRELPVPRGEEGPLCASGESQLGTAALAAFQGICPGGCNQQGSCPTTRLRAGPLDPQFGQTRSALHQKNDMPPLSLPCFHLRGRRC